MGEDDIYFLIGEKGTGKTAYAVYLSNNVTEENSGFIKYIRETDYLKFIKLKTNHKLDLSDYESIWTVIIYLLLAQHIIEKENNVLSNYFKLKALKNAIDEFYSNAFSPEIIQAIRFVEHWRKSARLVLSHFLASTNGELELQNQKEITSDKSLFQTNLLFIQRRFEDAFKSMSLSRNYTLFIDGIDLRPSKVSYDDYSECIDGLAHAVWSKNSDFFSSIKDSKGRLRVVLLLRPDIFETINLQNKNNKLHDNSVLLDWRTNFTDFRESPIFNLADNILKSQQSSNDKNSLYSGEAWDHYFPYNAKGEGKYYNRYTAFRDFLNFSYSRPRDLITMLELMQKSFKNKANKSKDFFSTDDFYNGFFLDELANYYLGEIKDELMFYYSEDNYNMFLRFFNHLSEEVNGNRSFSYYQYKNAFDSYIRYLLNNNCEIPPFCTDQNMFLQFLYEHNIICYNVTAVAHMGIKNIWCFQERKYGDVSPSVKFEKNYEIHAGLVNFIRVLENK